MHRLPNLESRRKDKDYILNIFHVKNNINLGYGTTVALETLVAFAKSNTAADLMWYICRVFGLPLPLKVAIVLRILLLTTGGWALINGINRICPELAKAIRERR